ncbi:cytochrome c3 family protein, partial [Kaarinaea lacus]
FCHTPHGGDNTAAVPIWNRRLNDPASYTRYSSLGTTTFDATEAPVGSVTIACLSCHDGTQAIDSVINAPGSGGYNPDGQRIGPNLVGDDIRIQGSMVEDIVQNLTTDLSNDHPVSMQYAGGGVSVQNPSGPSEDPDFVAGANPNLHPQAFTLNTMAAPPNASITTLWWIERNDSSLNIGGRDRTDVILYTRLESETGVPGGEQPFVECGSCHDPHNVDNPTFLRVSNGIPASLQTDFPNAVSPNQGSALCLTCHIK